MFDIIDYPMLLEPPFLNESCDTACLCPSLCPLTVFFTSPLKHIQRCSLTLFMSLGELTCYL